MSQKKNLKIKSTGFSFEAVETCITILKYDYVAWVS